MSKSEDLLHESMTVVKTGTCDTLTKKSKLTYHIGTLPDGEVYFRIHKNTGNGFFSNEWVALADIQVILSKIPVGKPVTAIVLSELFQGRSVNTPGFLLAVLANEKLIIPMQGKKRSHEPGDPGEFLDRLNSAGTKQKTATRKKAARTSPSAKKKAQLKKKSVASRKKKARTVRGS